MSSNVEHAIEFVKRHKTSIGAVATIVGTLATVFIGIGRFEANAAAHERAIVELRQAQVDARTDLEEKQERMRDDVIRRLDDVIEGQRYLGLRMDATNDRLRDLSVEVAATHAAARRKNAL